MSKPNHNSSPVYYAKDGQLRHGHVIGIYEPYISVRSGGPDNSTSTVSLHRSEVFTSYDVAVVGQDLLPEVQPGEEKHISQVAMELGEMPEQSSELLIRLGAEAMNRYISDERSERDLGIRTVEELIGSTEVVGSNDWKVQELIDGVSSRGYKVGVSNEISLSALSRDAMFLSPERQVEIRTKMVDVNRRALDHLYEKYGVNFDSATIYEKSHPDYREVVTVYPVVDEGVSFVETAFYSRYTAHTLASTLQSQRADIRVGTPAYSLEDGYTSAI